MSELNKDAEEATVEATAKKQNKKQTQEATADAGISLNVDEHSSLLKNFYQNYVKNYGKEPWIKMDQISAVSILDMEKSGLDLKMLEETGNLQDLVNGRMSKLLPINFNGVETFGKISFSKKNEDDPISVRVYPRKLKADLENYFSYGFSEEEKEMLSKTGNLGKVVDVQFVENEPAVPVLISLDKETNYLFSANANSLHIQDEFARVKLDDEQKAILAQGGIVELKGINSKHGAFDAPIQYNATKRKLDFVDDGITAPRRYRGVELSEDQRLDFSSGNPVTVKGISKIGSPDTKYNAIIMKKNNPDGSYSIETEFPRLMSRKKAAGEPAEEQEVSQKKGRKI